MSIRAGALVSDATSPLASTAKQAEELAQAIEVGIPWGVWRETGDAHEGADRGTDSRAMGPAAPDEPNAEADAVTTTVVTTTAVRVAPTTKRPNDLGGRAASARGAIIYLPPARAKQARIDETVGVPTNPPMFALLAFACDTEKQGR